MINMGLSLLTVALESGSHHIGTFPSLMNFVKDDLCKNLFWVGTPPSIFILAYSNAVLKLIFKFAAQGINMVKVKC